MLPPERVDETFEYNMDDEEVQRLGLTATNEFEIVQHIELRESPIHVTEHRLRIYLMPDGQKVTPDVLGVPVSRGYLTKLCTKTISDSLKFAYEELKAAIPHQEQLGSDETSFKNNGKKNWIWCISSMAFSVFHIATSRSRAVLEMLVGEEFKGYLNFDYFRFMFAENLEPTNNHSEQQIRHCIIDRRITQGTRSESGQRYHERMWTAIATCTKQNRSFFDFLHSSISAHLANQPTPSLLVD